MQINKYESSSYILNLKRKVRISENTFSFACHNAATSRFNGVFSCLLLLFFVNTHNLYTSSTCLILQTSLQMFHSNPRQHALVFKQNSLISCYIITSIHLPVKPREWFCCLRIREKYDLYTLQELWAISGDRRAFS